VLAVGAGDRDRFTWLVEKATELGATAILPLDTERTRGVATRLRPGGEVRLARRALEALKQCGGAWAPEVLPPMTLGAFLEVHGSGHGARWLGDAEGASPVPVAGNVPALAVVGPEGGLTADERNLLLRAGFAPVRFGPHILRFETAAVAALVLLQAHAGDY
jgi:16S rRNA (uracil1498-N3)-methyltransferase